MSVATAVDVRRLSVQLCARALRSLVLVLGLVAAVACSSSSGDGGATSDDAAEDTPGVNLSDAADTGGGLSDVVRDTKTPPVDTATDEPDTPRRKFGSPCLSNDDCESGWCIGWDEGFVCTELCDDACPEGWECRQVLNTLPDIVFACYPTTDSLCEQCAADFECGAGYCRTIGEEQRCTRPCSETRPCPAAYECAEIESEESGDSSTQCVPLSGVCDCGPVNVGRERACVYRNEFGTCWGSEVCDAEEGWVGCTATVPAAEDCNGADDDCDGSADEELVPPDDACANEVPDVGVCTGTWFCGGADGWQCTAQMPAEETCDYADNDCDGETDEGFLDPDTGEYLSLTDCGACGRPCEGTLPNATESCELRDDGPACVVDTCDEGFLRLDDVTCIPTNPTLCQPCLNDDACISPGDRCIPLDTGSFCGRDCSPGSIHGACPDGYECVQPFPELPDVQQCAPLSGSCDCTPATDGLERGCFIENDIGRCFGTQICVAETGWEDCSARTPGPEVCNGVDDDCDGLPDEDSVPPGQPCQTTWDDPETGQTAVCTGDWVCTGDGPTDGWTCLAPPAGPEACDYRDNDCDGLTDEDFKTPGTDRYVSDEHCGACDASCDNVIPHAVESACDGDRPVPTCIVTRCEEGYYPVDGTYCRPVQDSSCQPCGSSDNCPIPGDRCMQIDGAGYCARDCSDGNVFGTPQGECGFGYECIADIAGGGWHCVPATGSCTCRQPQDAGTTRSCVRRNEYGTCTGLQQCDPAVGWSPCSGTEPGPEECDGIDNDCDGAVDESVSAPTEACVVENGFGSCSGDWTCAAEAGVTTWRCDAVTPSAELCDNLDNDCDGDVDEDFKDPVTGLYGDVDNCGLCGFSCEGAILFASEVACDASAAPAHCVAVSCEEGYFRPGGIDNVCVPLNVTDCSPCSEDAHCDGLPGVCTDIDQGSFCARDCGGAEDCPSDFICADGQCLPRSNSCTCLPQNDGDQRTCLVTNVWGTCSGTQTCQGGQRWSECTAPVPARETCNGLDDNCDGRIDENLSPPAPSCSRSNAYGECVGAWVCGTDDEDEVIWACNAPIPAPDVCDLVDNDCDGTVDEDFRDPGTGAYLDTEHCGACGVSCIGTIPHATTRCALYQGNPRCEVERCDAGYYQASPLTCLRATENLCSPCATDDNCQVPGDRCIELDGGSFCARDCSEGNLHDMPAGACPPGYECATLPDGAEQCRPVTGSCSCLPEDDGEVRPCVRASEFGTCFGQEVCDGVTGWSECTATVPGPEICDQVDNDCNNFVDDVPGRGASCNVENAFGSCPGQLDCAPGDTAIQCVGQVPAAEICNYADDDCNGLVDDGFDELYTICSVGSGACERYGFRECSADGTGTTCNATPGAPQPERCNRIDDDCDGDIDETWSELDEPCTVGTGACARDGIYVCDASGAGPACNAVPGDPIPEECNGLDDDCDGIVDPPDSIGCITFYLDEDQDTWGVEGTGVCLCLPDQERTALATGDCDDTRFEVNPSRPEICNYMDDDCDGLTDEDVLSECGDCDAFCSISNLGETGDEPFTPTVDNASGVWTDDAGGLVLDTDRINLSFIWIANSNEDTISQLNTISGAEVGRYRVCDNPSRTAVDLFGNMYVGCRNDDRVAKVILDRNLCPDRNGNGVIDTSIDLNGDRQITGSEILPFGQDECVAWVVSPLGRDRNAVARAMVVDRFNRPWVGYYNAVSGKGYLIQQLDPETGAVTREITNLPAGIYGLVIDQQGRVWGSGRHGGRLVRIDVESDPPLVRGYTPSGSCRSLYGIVVDAYGKVWLMNTNCGYVFRFDPDTEQFRTVSVNTGAYGYTRGVAANKDGLVAIAHHGPGCRLGRSVTVIDAQTLTVQRNVALASSGTTGAVGVAFDYQGFVWAVNQCTSNATKVDPVTGAVILTQPVGRNPYTYSDMTGYNLHVFTAPNGFYRHTIAGWPQYGTTWVSLDVDAHIPDNTYVDLRLRAAPTISTLRSQAWSDFLGPFPPQSFPYDLSSVPGLDEGDYLEFEFWMFSRDSGTTPTIWSVDVQYTATNPPE